MPIINIQKTYSEIFKSYGNPTLEEHINKIIELDEYLPHSSTFFCITNTQNLSFEYISKNMFRCLGINKDDLDKILALTNSNEGSSVSDIYINTFSINYKLSKQQNINAPQN